MAWTTPATAVAGTVLTAAWLNTYVRDNTNYLKEAAYPIGSVYIAVVSTNPATLLGFGTWTAFATGRTLVGIDAGQTEFDTVEETGGAKTHTLSASEMPSHTHSYTKVSSGSPKATDDGSGYDLITGITGAGATGSAGSGGAHNNLQPYIVTYMWKRTA